MKRNQKSSLKQHSAIRRKFPIKKRLHKKIKIPLGSGIRPRASENTLGDLTLNTGNLPKRVSEKKEEPVVPEEPEQVSIKPSQVQPVEKSELIPVEKEKSLKQSQTKQESQKEKDSAKFNKNSVFDSNFDDKKPEQVKNSFKPVLTEKEKRSYGTFEKNSFVTPKPDPGISKDF